MASVVPEADLWAARSGSPLRRFRPFAVAEKSARFGPTTDARPNSPMPITVACLPESLDYLVGADEQRLRHGQTERLGRFQVDDQLEFSRMLHRQISRFRAVEDPSGVNAGLAAVGSEARSIADKSTGSGKFAQVIDRWNGKARCQFDELLTPAAEECS